MPQPPAHPFTSLNELGQHGDGLPWGVLTYARHVKNAHLRLTATQRAKCPEPNQIRHHDRSKATYGFYMHGLRSRWEPPLSVPTEVGRRMGSCFKKSQQSSRPGFMTTCFSSKPIAHMLGERSAVRSIRNVIARGGSVPGC